MIPIAVILAAWAVGCVLGVHWLNKRGRHLSQALSGCSGCGGKTTVTPDAVNSRLLVSCRREGCGRISFHSVRASALSLFGLTQVVFTLVAAGLGLKLGEAVGFGAAGRVVVAAVSFLLGGIMARFLVMAVVYSLRKSKSPAWQEEIVAHLAPPPWRAQPPETKR